MYTIEEKILRSFKSMKTEIIKIQDEIMQVSNVQENILKEINLMNEQKSVVTNTKKKKAGRKPKKKVAKKTTKVVRVVAPKTVAKYVAAETGKKFHIEACPFAKNIKPMSKVIFNTKDDALNKGYKPCSCVMKI